MNIPEEKIFYFVLLTLWISCDGYTSDGYSLSLDNVFTRVPFEGQSIMIWKLNNTDIFYMSPVALMKKESVEFVDSVDTTATRNNNLKFEIILTNRITEQTVLNYLRRKTGECIMKKQIKMVQTQSISILLRSNEIWFESDKSWNIPLTSNQEILTLNIDCKTELLCNLYKDMLQKMPNIKLTFSATGNQFIQKVMLGNSNEGHDVALMEEAPCKNKGQRDMDQMRSDINDLRNDVRKMVVLFQRIATTNEQILKSLSSNAIDCSTLASGKNGSPSGVYDLEHDGKKVYCDMDTSGGGWTVLMRRRDGSVNFRRPWKDYRNGFGSLDGEFWLGNEKMHKLTWGRQVTIRIDVVDKDSRHLVGVAENFRVHSEIGNYQMSFENLVGNITSRFQFSNEGGNQFSTYDRDNDESNGSCARSYRAGWWFNNCHYLCLTCKYDPRRQLFDVGRFKRAEMKIR